MCKPLFWSNIIYLEISWIYDIGLLIKRDKKSEFVANPLQNFLKELFMILICCQLNKVKPPFLYIMINPFTIPNILNPAAKNKKEESCYKWSWIKLFCYKTRIRCRKIDCSGSHLIFSQTKLNLYLSFKYLKTQENLSENQPEILVRDSKYIRCRSLDSSYIHYTVILYLSKYIRCRSLDSSSTLYSNLVSL